MKAKKLQTEKMRSQQQQTAPTANSRNRSKVVIGRVGYVSTITIPEERRVGNAKHTVHRSLPRLPRLLRLLRLSLAPDTKPERNKRNDNETTTTATIAGRNGTETISSNRTMMTTMRWEKMRGEGSHR
jgi:hypothetical protein